MCSRDSWPSSRLTNLLLRAKWRKSMIHMYRHQQRTLKIAFWQTGDEDVIGWSAALMDTAGHLSTEGSDSEGATPEPLHAWEPHSAVVFKSSEKSFGFLQLHLLPSRQSSVLLPAHLQGSLQEEHRLHQWMWLLKSALWVRNTEANSCMSHLKTRSPEPR